MAENDPHSVESIIGVLKGPSGEIAIAAFEGTIAMMRLEQEVKDAEGARLERAELRAYRLKIGGGVALVVLLLAFVLLTPAKDRPEQVKQVLTALIAAIPTGFAAFFAGKYAYVERG